MIKNPFERYLPISEVEESAAELEFGISISKESNARASILRKVAPLLGGACILYFALFGRLLDLQISQGAYFRLLALGNSIRTSDIVAPRGLIVAEDGSLLVKNVPHFSLEITPAYLPAADEERATLFETITQVTGLPVDQHTLAEVGRTLEPVVLADHIPYDQAIVWEVQLTNLPGITMAKRPDRAYEDIPGIAHILGYIGKISREELDAAQARGDRRYGYTSVIGKTGLELTYEDVLKGVDGKTQVEVDARGRKIRQLASIPPEPGHTLILALHRVVQETLSRSLADSVKRVGSQAGAAIAINPKTGGILGMASFPTFEPEVFSGGGSRDEAMRLLSNPNHPLVNRAIAGVYPPGSTIKPLWAAAALQEGIINTKSSVLSVGGFTVGQFAFRDWKAGGHGITDVKKAIAESVNTFFYAVTGGHGGIPGLGIERLEWYARQFGIGQVTGVDLPGEGRGFFPNPDWKRRTRGEGWFVGNTYQVGIGQGDVLVTPVELLIAEVSIVNGGELLRPRLAERIVDAEGLVVEEFPKEVIGRIPINPVHLEVVKEGMRMTVTDGSARTLADLPVEAAGKTGTAQYASNRKTHAWFFGFAPWQDPEIAILVLVEGGGEGTIAAAPVAKEVFRAYFSQMAQ
jgi:penicillin-binding protein 2